MSYVQQYNGIVISCLAPVKGNKQNLNYKLLKYQGKNEYCVQGQYVYEQQSQIGMFTKYTVNVHARSGSPLEV